MDGGVRDAFPILPLPSFLLPPVAVRWLGMDGKEVKGKERDRLPAFFFHQNPFIISLFLMSWLSRNLYLPGQGREGCGREEVLRPDKNLVRLGNEESNGMGKWRTFYPFSTLFQPQILRVYIGLGLRCGKETERRERKRNVRYLPIIYPLPSFHCKFIHLFIIHNHNLKSRNCI